MNEEREAFENLPELLAALAGKMGDVAANDRGEVIEYRRGDVRFAAVDARAVELRLHPEIAEAARRTPSTTASARGPEWVRFAPPTLDEHTLDRAEAWFLSAWRAAARKSG